MAVAANSAAPARLLTPLTAPVARSNAVLCAGQTMHLSGVTLALSRAVLPCIDRFKWEHLLDTAYTTPSTSCTSTCCAARVARATQQCALQARPGGARDSDERAPARACPLTSTTARPPLALSSVRVVTLVKLWRSSSALQPRTGGGARNAPSRDAHRRALPLRGALPLRQADADE